MTDDEFGPEPYPEYHAERDRTIADAGADLRAALKEYPPAIRMHVMAEEMARLSSGSVNLYYEERDSDD